MGGYIGRGQPVAVDDGSVETSDIEDNAVTDAKLNSTKLDGIESNATADQTGAQIKTAYEAESDTNALTDTLKTKLDGIEANATADQTGAQIKTAYEAESGAYNSTKDSKLSGIASSANNYSHPTSAGSKHVPTGGSSGQFLKYDSSGTAVWAADNNDNTTYSVGDGGLTQKNFTTTLKSKLDAIESNATADQTKSDIEALGIELPAANLTGTVADARISTLTSSKLTGALPAISGANLTDIETMTKSNTEPSSPSTGDLWYHLTNQQLKVYNGNSWSIISDEGPTTTGGTVTITEVLETLSYSYDTKVDFDDNDGDSRLVFFLNSGTLPVGTSLNTDTGVISGTPEVTSATGTVTYTFSIEAIDFYNNTIVQNYSSPIGKGPEFVAATGGTVTTSGDYKIHRFTSSGTLTFTSDGNSLGSNSIEYMLVGGGGGGGQNGGGGGGGGGVLYSASYSGFNLQAYSIVIGSGGSKGTSNGDAGNQGTNTTGLGFTAIGGGGGDSRDGGNPTSGGSGGGGSSGSSGGSGTSGQGHAGGSGAGGGCDATGGGGGGAGAAGTNGSSNSPGTGGNGVTHMGYSVGGGGGAGVTCGGTTSGGSGGGGSNAGTGGTNQGGGGGGHGSNTGGSGDGGSGVAVFKYKYQ